MLLRHCTHTYTWHDVCESAATAPHVELSGVQTSPVCEFLVHGMMDVRADRRIRDFAYTTDLVLTIELRAARETTARATECIGVVRKCREQRELLARGSRAA